MEQILAQLLDDGLRGAAMILLLVVSVKIYRARITSDSQSDCCKSCFKMHITTENMGTITTENMGAITEI